MTGQLQGARWTDAALQLVESEDLAREAYQLSGRFVSNSKARGIISHTGDPFARFNGKGSLRHSCGERPSTEIPSGSSPRREVGDHKGRFASG
jgi:hypothetical protein